MILYSCQTPICWRNCYCLRPRKVSCPHITWQVEARDVPRKFSIACGSGLEDEISFWDGLGFKEGMPFSHNTWRPPAMLQRHLHPTHPRVVRQSCCKPSSRPYVACICREAIHSSFSWFILQGWTLHVPPKHHLQGSEIPGFPILGGDAWKSFKRGHISKPLCARVKGKNFLSPGKNLGKIIHENSKGVKRSVSGVPFQKGHNMRVPMCCRCINMQPGVAV